MNPKIITNNFELPTDTISAILCLLDRASSWKLNKERPT